MTDVRRADAWFACSSSALLALAWLLPNHYVPWRAFHADFLAGTALMVWLCWVVARAPVVQRVPVLAAVVVAIATVPPSQHAAGQIHFAGDAWLATTYLLAFACSIYVGFASRGAGMRVLEPLAWAITVAAAASSVLALCQWLGVHRGGIAMMELRFGDRPYANFAQPNQLATALMMGLACALLLHQWRYLSGHMLAVLAGLLCVSVVLTQSRAGWLEVAGMSAWLLLVRERAGLRIERRAVVAAVAVFVLLVLALPWLGELLHLSSRGTAAQLESGTRPIHWATTLDAIRLRPWTGYGWNQLSVAVAHTVQSHPTSHEMVEHSHNLLLDLLAWNGVPIGLAIIAGGAWWLWRRASSCKDATGALTLAAIAMPLFHSMVEFPLEYAYMLLPVGFLVGTLEAPRDEARTIPVPRALMACVAALGAAMLVWIGVEYLEVEENTRVLRLESARIGTARIESTAPDVRLLTQQREFLRFARTEATPGMRHEQLDWMRKVAERYGYAPVLFRYALATGLNGQPEAAAHALVRLCKTSPAPVCEEARVNWLSMSETYPVLQEVALPADH